MRYSTPVVLIFTLLLGVANPACSDSTSSYRIYLAQGNRQYLTLKGTTVIDCRTSERRTIREKFRSELRDGTYYQLNPKVKPYSKLSINGLDYSSIPALMTELGPPGNDRYVLYHYMTMFHPDSGIQIVNVLVEDRDVPPGQRFVDIMVVLLAYHQSTDSYTLIDSILFPRPAGTMSLGCPIKQNCLDWQCEYVYYSKHGSAWRYNLVDGTREQLPVGNVPVVPWNGPGTLVYSQPEKVMMMLDSKTLHVEAQIRTDDFSCPITCYVIAENKYLVGHSVPPTMMDHNPKMAVCLYDFERGKVEELFRCDSGQVLRAEPIED